jgi:hypothetical protein
MALAGAIAALTAFALGRVPARHGEESVTEPQGGAAVTRQLAIDESSAH